MNNDVIIEYSLTGWAKQQNISKLLLR